MDKLEVLQKYFGYSAFRPGQEEPIDALLRGQDVLCVMPTGAGKSLCYQIPALVLDGMAIVISPLISLMQDQVFSLKANGVPAAFLNSSLTPGQQAEAMRRAMRGMYKLMYVAPERLDQEDFREFAANMNISLIAVDEAHCVSQWGQDFRPSYLRIADFIAMLPKRPPVGAFTATATGRVQQDMQKLLQLRGAKAVRTGFDRPNLRFISQKPADRFAALLEILDRHAEDSVIIYCGTRKNVETIHKKLSAEGFSVGKYHAGLADSERRETQERFKFGTDKIIVATNAFGMGIDKPDVRCVIHYNMPQDIESYYQEAGRAGRDGLEAECILLYGKSDVILAGRLIEMTEENPEMTAEEQRFAKMLRQDRLRQMTFYSNSKKCLRAFMLRYFGENAPANCGNCSVCLGMPFETGEEVKKTAIGKNAPMTADQLQLYSILVHVRETLAKQDHVGVSSVIGTATLAKLAIQKPASLKDLQKNCGYGGDRVRKYGEAFLEAISEHTGVPVVKNQPTASRKSSTFIASDFTRNQQDLYDKLAAQRMICAEKIRRPAFVVFSNTTLVDMVRKLPLNKREFLTVQGVGEAKCEQYADIFTEIIRQHVGSKTHEDKPWTEEEEEILALEHARGESLEKIAALHGRTQANVRAKLNEIGVL